MIRYNKIKDPKPYTVYRAYQHNICQKILVESRGAGDIIQLTADERGDWERLFRNCEVPQDMRTWMESKLTIQRIGRDRGGLREWTRINDKRGSKPLWQFAVLMTNSPGARIETESWVAEPQWGELVIYPVDRRHRLLGSTVAHTVYITGTLQADENNSQ